MKKLILLLSTILLIINVNAQKITFTANDLAITGDSFSMLKIQYDSTNMLSINDVDPFAWDFSNIIANTEDIVNILSKDDFPELASLPDGTMVMEQDEQSYICLNLNGDLLQMLGLLVNLNGTWTPLIFPEPQNVLHMPLTIGEGGSSEITFPITGTPEDFGFEIPFHDSVRFDINVLATTMVEDTGTIQTFQYSKSAFKVANTTIFSVDIWALPSFGSWYLFQENIVADSTKLLQFYNPEYGIPMVEVGLTWNDSILSYKMMDEDAQSIVGTKSGDINVYPNPIAARKNLYFTQKLKNISLYDITGRLIIQHEGIYKQIEIPNLPDGYYILKAEKPFITKRIVVDN
ncbi:MAG: hypothetical protein C0599_12045 [Salinivirgaceae bacterium]|nr:MAG: hypothetical protein C0599_12045 [Salinivirgaceae bacterium]